jgi:hypothetical protein
MIALKLLIAFAIPWSLGAISARHFMGKRLSLPLYLGHGVLLGHLIVVLHLQIYHWLGRPFAFFEMALTQVVVLIAVLSHELRAFTPAGLTRATLPLTPISAWRVVLFSLLISVAGAHLYFVLSEILLRPLYAWDAWSGWVPQSLQYFDTRSLDAAIATKRNYGVLSTHLHVWTMLAVGSSDALVTNLSWFGAYIGIALAVGGHLRRETSGVGAMTGAVAVLSLPLLTVHAALPGYADIWLTLAFVLAAATLQAALRSREARVFLLFSVYVLACFLTKRAGFGLSLVLVCLCMTALLLQRIGWRWLMASAIMLTLAAAAGAHFVSTMPLKAQIPLIGAVELSSERLSIAGLFRYRLNPQVTIQPIMEALLCFANWHLAATLFLVTLLATASSSARRDRAATVEDNHLQVGGSGVIAAAIFGALAITLTYFTLIASKSAFDHSGLDRAVMYTVPLMVLWSIASLYRVARTTQRGKDQPSVVSRRAGI